MKPWMRWTCLGIGLGIGVAFVLAGIWLGQHREVFEKAIRICLECIGIG